MFEDVDYKQLQNPFEADDSMSDRQVLYVIWGCEETGDLPTDQAWSLLSERYPDDGRFVLMNLVEELRNARYPYDYPAELLMKKLGRLNPHRLALAEPLRHLAPMLNEIEQDLEPRDQKKLGILSARFLKPEPELVDAYRYFTAYSRELVQELHTATSGNKPIAKR